MIDTVLLIAEAGARWDELAVRLCAPHRQLVVVLQQTREATRAFRQRVAATFERLERQRVQLHQVVLFEGPRHDGLALLSRAQILRSIANRLAWARRQVRIIVHTYNASAPAARYTRALIDAISAGLEHAFVTLEIAAPQLLSNQLTN